MSNCIELRKRLRFLPHGQPGAREGRIHHDDPCLSLWFSTRRRDERGGAREFDESVESSYRLVKAMSQAK